MSVALEIERYLMDGAVDAADVEPQPTPSAGQAPRCAGDDGGPDHDVIMSDLPSEGGPLPMHGQASGWHPNGTRMPHVYIYIDTSTIPDNTWVQSLTCCAHLPTQVDDRRVCVQEAGYLVLPARAFSIDAAHIG